MTNKEKEISGWEGFVDLCQQARTKTQLDELLNLFLTLEEKEQISARYRIFQAFLEGTMTQREMATSLKVSIAQITRGSNALKGMNNPQLKEFLFQQMKKDE